MKKIALLLAISIILSSCMVTKTYVGQYQNLPGKELRYAKGRQFWIFWGLLPMGRTNVKTPLDGHCEIKTSYDFVDLLVRTITAGFITSYSIEVSAKSEISTTTENNSITTRPVSAKIETAKLETKFTNQPIKSENFIDGDRCFYVNPKTSEVSEAVIKKILSNRKAIIQVDKYMFEVDINSLREI
jgi:hypothetical protein